jgi:hypothetical protein
VNITRDVVILTLSDSMTRILRVIIILFFSVVINITILSHKRKNYSTI